MAVSADTVTAFMVGGTLTASQGGPSLVMHVFEGMFKLLSSGL